ncbi:hypothetical protein AB833_20790 [Chromatiales bacterium (ex Bugula neritina AB1)]|nr:hypothetical protein AB833_20790 [Chromatiales bacterium (ex Bugula neritina AB1)]
MNAADTESFDFGFFKDRPGQLVELENHRLHADCRGKGLTTVLFEAGLGGSALEWVPIRDQIAGRTRVCIYDRAGYAWSDPSPYPRYARQLAAEASAMLHKLGLTQSLILVGHSFGGLVVRELAGLPGIQVKAMVLIDSSHEDQFKHMRVEGGKAIVPTGEHFVFSPGDAPENLPQQLRRKIKALSRMRKTYAATHAEMAKFTDSADQVASTRSVVEYPVTVVSRGLDLYPVAATGLDRNTIWQQLQSDLVSLSSDGRFVLAQNSGHHVHVDDPALIVRIIEELLDEIDQQPH